MADAYRVAPDMFDKELEFKDSAAVTASAAAQVSAAAKVIDVQDANFVGVMRINITALDLASADEVYRVVVQGSNSSTFASGVHDLAAKIFGDSTAVPSGSDSTTGNYLLFFSNAHELAGGALRYLRLYTEVAGTTPSITYSAYAVELKQK